MTAFDPTGLTVQLAIGTPGSMVPMQSRITWWQNLGELDNGPEFRGEDKLIPHLPGEVPRARHIAKKTVTLIGLIRGDRNILNDPYASAVAGLKSNLNYLNYYCTPRFSTETDKTRRVQLTTALGVEYGPGHVTFRTGDLVGPALRRITAEISLPTGGLWQPPSG